MLTSSKNTIHKIVSFLLCAAVILLMLPTNNYIVYGDEIKGKLTGDYVNVRTGAGTGFDYLRDIAGNRIKLDVNHDVTIIGEEYASDGSKWYNVRFYYGGTSYTGYVYGEYVKKLDPVNYVEDADFEKYLSDQGFPESYKESLRRLHASYPKWVFVADKLDYTWEEVLDAQSIVGRNLVPKTSISSWKSMEQGAYDYTTGSWYGFDGSDWVAASRSIVAFCMDPRNSLDETLIFQFEKLDYDSTTQTVEGTKAVTVGTYMENTVIKDGDGNDSSYAQVLNQIGMAVGVSPYHLASRIIQETGYTGESKSVSGKVPGYEGYYNYYNQGAYAHSGRSAVINGLIYAKNLGWDTRYKALLGGANYIGKNYINIGQNTLYYEKFDFCGTPYSHQYMSNILAPRSEAITVAKGYTEDMRKNVNLVFNIPVFKDMPEQPCEKPVGDGNPVCVLSELNVDGYSLTPTFNKFVYEYDLIVDKSVETVNITAKVISLSSKLTGVGMTKLNEGLNTINVTVTAQNKETCTYVLNIVRGEEETKPQPTPIPTPPADVTTPNGYKIETEYIINEETNIIYGIAPNTSVADAISKIKTSEGSVYFLKEDNTTNEQLVGTGNIVLLADKDGNAVKKYQVIIYGDIDGDGEHTIFDMLYIKRHILGTGKLEGIKLIASDCDRKGDETSLFDLATLKQSILGTITINQK